MYRIFLILLVFVGLAFGELQIYPQFNFQYIEHSTYWKSRYWHGSDILYSDLYYPNVMRTLGIGLTFEEYNFFFSVKSDFINYSSKQGGWDRDYWGGLLWYESVFDVKTKYIQFDVKAGYRHKWFFCYMGIEHLDIKYTMINCYYTGLNSYECYLRISGLNSTYKLRGDSPVFGIGAKSELFDNFYFNCVIEYGPFYDLEGRGYWNLRQLRFKHDFHKLEKIKLGFGFSYIFNDAMEIRAFYENSLIKGWGKNIEWKERYHKEVTDIWPIDLEYESEIFGIGLQLYGSLSGIIKEF